MFNLLFFAGVLSPATSGPSIPLKSNLNCIGKFACINLRQCVPLNKQCDGIPDCTDGSDELDCDMFKCTKPEFFRCKNERCISSKFVCDSENDCEDFSDEENCENEEKHIQNTFMCEEYHQWPCSNKLCIPKKLYNKNKWYIYVYTYDGVSNCLDGSDEIIGCNKTTECADTNLCLDFNECEIYGICDQKCQNLPGSYKCTCDDNYSLQDDKKSCTAQYGEAFMIYSINDEIRAYLLRSKISLTLAKNLSLAIGVDFDGKYIYWINNQLKNESIIKFLQNSDQKEILVTADLESPEDVYVDYITKNIYFTDAERRHIAVCTNTGSYLTNEVQKPRAIVLNPLEGEMYWTDWGDQAKIARALMDGTLVSSFVSSEIHWPNGITIDYLNSRLYWTDGKLKTIESIRLDGTDRRIILDKVVEHPYAITIFENRLYWSDWSTHSIQSCDKFTGENHKTIISQDKTIYGIKIYHPNNHKKPSNNPCDHNLCSEICLLKGPSNYSCVSSKNKQLSSYKQTCINIGKNKIKEIFTEIKRNIDNIYNLLTTIMEPVEN